MRSNNDQRTIEMQHSFCWGENSAFCAKFSLAKIKFNTTSAPAAASGRSDFKE